MADAKDNPGKTSRDFYPQRGYTVDEILEEAKLLKSRRRGGGFAARPSGALTRRELLGGGQPTDKMAATGRSPVSSGQSAPHRSPSSFAPAQQPASRSRHANDPVSAAMERAFGNVESPTAPRGSATQPDRLPMPKAPPQTTSSPSIAQSPSFGPHDRGRPAGRTDVLYKKADVVLSPPDKNTQYIPAGHEPSVQNRVQDHPESTGRMSGAVRAFTNSQSAAERIEDRPSFAASSSDSPTLLFRQELEKEKASDLTGQVVIPGFEPEVSDQSQSTEQGGTWGDFVKQRKKKVQDFVLSGSEGEPKPKPCDNETMDTEDDETSSLSDQIDDYTSPGDAAPISYDLTLRKRSIGRQLVATSIIGFLLLILTTAHLLRIPLLGSDNPMVYLGVSALLTAAAVGINASAVFGGFFSLFRLRVDLDTAVASAVLVALGHNLLMFLFPHHVADGGLSVFGAPAVLGLVLNSAGKFSMITRILDNFSLVANENLKKASVLVDDQNQAYEMSRGLAMGHAAVCCQKKTKLLKQYLSHSYSEDVADKMGQKMVPFVLLGGLAATLIALIFGVDRGIDTALTAFAAAVCVCVPAMSLLAGNVPLAAECRRLRQQGTLLSGYDAVEEFSSVGVAAIEARELFPDDTVHLYSIKTFGVQSIDRALLDAAGVAIMANGPVASIFERVVEGRYNILPPVDTLLYEDKMGISGWVDGRRVLIGNRQLMENHNIGMPDADFEARYTRGGRFAVYLATGGALSAMFVIGYKADEQIAQALVRAVQTGLGITVYSSDPNLSPDMLSRTFRISEHSIRVMGPAARLAYQSVSAAEPSADGALAHTGGVREFLQALSSCIRLHRRLSVAAAAQAVLAVLGFVLMMVLTVSSGVGTVQATYVVGYQLLATLVATGLPLLLP